MALQVVFELASEGTSPRLLNLGSGMKAGDLVLFYLRNATSVDVPVFTPTPGQHFALNSGSEYVGYWYVANDGDLITVEAAEPGSRLSFYVCVIRSTVGIITDIDSMRSWSASAFSGADIGPFNWELGQFGPPFSTELSDTRQFVQWGYSVNVSADPTTYPYWSTIGHGAVSSGKDIEELGPFATHFATIYSVTDSPDGDVTTWTVASDQAGGILQVRGGALLLGVTVPPPSTGGGSLTPRARKTQYNNLPYEVSSAMIRRR